MQYPGHAGLDADFRKIQFLCDVAIAEALANQTIDWAQHSHFFPKDTHEVNLHVRFFEHNRGANRPPFSTFRPCRRQLLPSFPLPCSRLSALRWSAFRRRTTP